jgi:hypothetical protein
VVAQATVDFAGGDVLFGFSGTAWTQQPGPIGLTVWLDDEPLGGALSVWATFGATHLSLGRSWVHAPGVTPGQHKLMVVASPSTITDQNDRVNLTQVELGDGLAVGTTTDVPCPTGTNQVLSKQRFRVGDGPFMLSGSGSGSVGQIGGTVGIAMLFEGGDPVLSRAYANWANGRFATVPADVVYPNEDGQHGESMISLQALPNVATDDTDIAHLAAIDWVDPSQAPVQVTMVPYLQDYVAASQSGGDYIAQSQFECNGGPLLFRTSLSAWTSSTGMIGATIEIDGNPLGSIELFANVGNTHLTLPSNDFVATGIPAGRHSFQLQAGASTITDVNDRVSVLALEFPQ